MEWRGKKAEEGVEDEDADADEGNKTGSQKREYQSRIAFASRVEGLHCP